jgi:hypothetical protein
VRYNDGRHRPCHKSETQTPLEFRPNGAEG